jgi:hypothetical protein
MRVTIAHFSRRTCNTGFGKLISAQLLAAPVFEKTSQKYIGYLEIRDLLSIIISVSACLAQCDESD